MPTPTKTSTTATPTTLQPRRQPLRRQQTPLLPPPPPPPPPPHRVGPAGRAQTWQPRALPPRRAVGRGRDVAAARPAAEAHGRDGSKCSRITTQQEWRGRFAARCAGPAALRAASARTCANVMVPDFSATVLNDLSRSVPSGRAQAAEAGHRVLAAARRGALMQRSGAHPHAPASSNRETLMECRYSDEKGLWAPSIVKPKKAISVALLASAPAGSCRLVAECERAAHNVTRARPGSGIASARQQIYGRQSQRRRIPLRRSDHSLAHFDESASFGAPTIAWTRRRGIATRARRLATAPRAARGAWTRL